MVETRNRGRERDHAAFSELVRSHDARLRGLAYRMLGGDRARMDDVLQDAYLRAYRAFADFRHESSPGTWLHRVVYTACVDEIRRTERRPRLYDYEAPPDRESERPGPERIVTTQDVVLRALAQLPEDQRATVLLVDGEGFDNVSVAEILGVAPGTVASRLSRARATLRTLLGEEGRQ